LNQYAAPASGILTSRLTLCILQPILIILHHKSFIGRQSSTQYRQVAVHVLSFFLPLTVNSNTCKLETAQRHGAVHEDLDTAFVCSWALVAAPLLQEFLRFENDIRGPLKNCLRELNSLAGED